MSKSIQERLRGMSDIPLEGDDNVDPLIEVFWHLGTSAADYIDKLEDALRFYADPENYELVDPRNTLVDFDEGKRAREALEK